MVEPINASDSISSHEDYAIRKQEIARFLELFHVEKIDQATFTTITRIIDFVPKLDAVYLLLEIYKKNQWAHFSFPPGVMDQRFFNSNDSSIGTLDQVKELRERALLAFDAMKHSLTPKEQEDEELEKIYVISLLDFLINNKQDLLEIKKSLLLFVHV